MIESKRPDPDELLKQLECEEAESCRGRLKIFLGYAPRVGKTQRMLDEGLRRKSRGQDVVVGAVQVGSGQQAPPACNTLEIIPLLDLPDGQTMDIDAIVKRQPAVCIVDQLAYTNPPGAQFSARWKEVGYLLQHEINVLTALNLQYVTELQDQVEQITGKRAKVSVPEEFIRTADEIVVVDVPADDLADSTVEPDSEKSVYASKLSHLRELALIMAADVVEGELQRYMERHGITQTWGTQERILVCITARSNARAMLSSGRRNVDRSHGQLFAVYVSSDTLNREGELTLNDNLEQARKLGAEVHVLESRDPVEAIVRFAREHRITQIFIGHTLKRQLLPWKKGVVERIIEQAEGMDVRIFPQSLN